MLTCTVGLQSGSVEWDGISIHHPHIPRPRNPIRASWECERDKMMRSHVGVAKALLCSEAMAASGVVDQGSRRGERSRDGSHVAREIGLTCGPFGERRAV